MKKILVPIDGSDNSKLALEKAKQLAILSGAEITVITVIKDVITHLYSMENQDRMEIERVFQAQGDEIIEYGLKTFKGCKNEIRTKVLKGNPAEVIIEMADEEDFDLIVMGSRGLNAFSRVMIGSISSKVLNHVETSVLIVK